MEDPQTILSELQNFTTSTTQYHDWNIVGEYRMKLSDGDMCLRHAEGSESLIMRIAQAQHGNGLGIRSYKPTVADRKGELSASDESGNLLGRIEIEETDSNRRRRLLL